MKLIVALVLTLTLGFFIGSNMSLFGSKISKPTPSDISGPFEAISISDGNKTVTLIDAESMSEILSFFKSFDKKEGVVKILSKYRIHFYSQGTAKTIRVTEAGVLLADVPASEIQTAYNPAQNGLLDVILRHLNSK